MIYRGCPLVLYKPSDRPQRRPRAEFSGSVWFSRLKRHNRVSLFTPELDSVGARAVRVELAR
jgi:hypothetical protein